MALETAKHHQNRQIPPEPKQAKQDRQHDHVLPTQRLPKHVKVVVCSNRTLLHLLYDIVHVDAFIGPKPYPSWVLNKSTCQWESPVPMPTDVGTGTPPKFCNCLDIPWQY